MWRTVDQLDDVANNAHDQKADTDGLRDLDEFPLERVSDDAEIGREDAPCLAWCSGSRTEGRP